MFRKDRFTCVGGQDRLVPHKLRPDSATSRYVANCCSSALYLGFESGQHWVSVMTDRIDGPKPRIEARIMTEFRTSAAPYPDYAPVHAKYPVRCCSR